MNAREKHIEYLNNEIRRLEKKSDLSVDQKDLLIRYKRELLQMKCESTHMGALVMDVHPIFTKEYGGDHSSIIKGATKL